MLSFVVYICVYELGGLLGQFCFPSVRKFCLSLWMPDQKRMNAMDHNSAHVTQVPFFHPVCFYSNTNTTLNTGTTGGQLQRRDDRVRPAQDVGAHEEPKVCRPRHRRGCGRPLPVRYAIIIIFIWGGRGAVKHEPDFS